MAASTEFDPNDIEGAEARVEERERQAVAARITADADLVWLLSGQRGRRMVRQQLRDSGTLPGDIRSSFNSNFGQMCHTEGLRDRGLDLLSRITALLASGKLPLESFQNLVMEKD